MRRSTRGLLRRSRLALRKSQQLKDAIAMIASGHERLPQLVEIIQPGEPTSEMIFGESNPTVIEIHLWSDETARKMILEDPFLSEQERDAKLRILHEARKGAIETPDIP